MVAVLKRPPQDGRFNRFELFHLDVTAEPIYYRLEGKADEQGGWAFRVTIGMKKAGEMIWVARSPKAVFPEKRESVPWQKNMTRSS